jgi:hypothetical protein
MTCRILARSEDCALVEEARALTVTWLGGRLPEVTWRGAQYSLARLMLDSRLSRPLAAALHPGLRWPRKALIMAPARVSRPPFAALASQPDVPGWASTAANDRSTSAAKRLDRTALLNASSDVSRQRRWVLR